MKLSKFSPIGRAIGVMGVTAGLVTGVTFAAFNTNSVVLADSDLSVSSDVLRISNGGAYGTEVQGFTDNLTPNTESPKHKFYLQNLADADLKISVGVTAEDGNLQGGNVIFKFYNEAGVLVLEKTYTELATAPQTLNGELDALAAGNGDEAATEGDYSYTVTVEDEGITGSSGQLSNYDLTFTGTSIDGTGSGADTSGDS